MVVGRARGPLVALLALVALLLGAAPALAHSDLRSSDPADGAVLADAPAGISFTFNEELLPQGNAITLTDTASGERLEVPAASVDGDTVSVPWPADAPAGQYRAAYRVVSADGHPIAGTVTFTVEAGASPTPDAATGASATASPGATAPTAPSATPVASPQPVAGPADTEDADMLVWALAIGLVVLAAVGGATWYARRSR
jgi:copper resistance protein C